MKTIALNKGTLELPDSWEDLTFRQKIYVFGLLREVMSLQLDPTVFRIRVLGYLTGYKPQSGVFSFMVRGLLYLLAKLFVALYYRTALGSVRYRAYWQIWKTNNRPELPDRTIINFNLYRLSEQIDFAFRLEGNNIIPNRVFKRNPVPYIKINGIKLTGRKFIRDIAPFTNITGREFSDCFDLLMGYSTLRDSEEKEKCIDRIISILYPCTGDYNENMVSGHAELIAGIDPGLKFGIFQWFIGIAEYYFTHPYYSILFRSGAGDDNPGRISLGMNEVTLMVANKGYRETDNLNNFFDAQIKILKDRIADAIGRGAKKEELAKSLNMDISDLNKLL